MNNFEEADIGTWWKYVCDLKEFAPLFAFKDYTNFTSWTIEPKSVIIKLEKQFHSRSIGKERYRVLIVNTDADVRVAWIDETHTLKPFKEYTNV